MEIVNNPTSNADGRPTPTTDRSAVSSDRQTATFAEMARTMQRL